MTRIPEFLTASFTALGTAAAFDGYQWGAATLLALAVFWLIIALKDE